MADVWANLWHIIPEPSATLQGAATCRIQCHDPRAATWWIHCHNSTATCHIAGCSLLVKSMSWSCHMAEYKNSIRLIENHFRYIFVVFFKAVLALTSAAFVSSPIHLYCIHIYPIALYTCCFLFFLPRDVMISATYAIMRCLSVRPSVCLSVTFVDHVKTNKHIFEIFSPPGSHTILVFPYQTIFRRESP